MSAGPGRRWLLVALLVAAAVATGGCLGDVGQSGVADGGEQGGDGDRSDDTMWFEEVSADAGLAYVSRSRGAGRGDHFYQDGMVNPGVYVADVDRDGWPDVLALGADRAPRLFVNRGGRFEATDLPVGDRSFVAAVFFDYDGDGWDDLWLLADDGGIFLENREGRFVETDVGIGDRRLPNVWGATAADFDGDGCLDLFVYSQGDWLEENPVAWNAYYLANASLLEDNGEPNRLFDGDCERFTEVTEGSGIAGGGWSLAASAVDLTGDGRPDVHVANDFNNDVVYLNRGDHSFERRVLGNATNRNGMSSEIGDVDHDGRPDVFVSNIYLANRSRATADRPLRLEGHNLLVNRGDGHFVDRAEQYGVRRPGWGWAASLRDLDGDGDRDLFQATTFDESYPAVGLWERRGDRFVPRRYEAAATADNMGLAALDHDRDGDVDYVASTYNGSYDLYENRGAPEHWLQVRVGGEAPALGAVVDVTVDGDRQRRWVTAETDYLSQGTRVRQFGLDSSERVDRLRVTWPDGTRRTFGDVAGDRRIRVTPDGLERVRAAR